MSLPCPASNPLCVRDAALPFTSTSSFDIYDFTTTTTVTITDCAEPTTLSTVVVRPTTTQAPPPPPEDPKVDQTVGDRVCNNEDIFTGHPDISIGFVTAYEQQLCNGLDSDDNLMGPDSQPLIIQQVGGGVKYFMSISWKDGCKSVHDKISPGKPADNDPVTCDDLLLDNFKKCNNGGLGGHIDVGCLRYEFTPQSA